MTIFQDKLLTGTYCDEAGYYAVPNMLSSRKPSHKTLLIGQNCTIIVKDLHKYVSYTVRNQFLRLDIEKRDQIILWMLISPSYPSYTSSYQLPDIKDSVIPKHHHGAKVDPPLRSIPRQAIWHIITTCSKLPSLYLLAYSSSENVFLQKHRRFSGFVTLNANRQ